MSASEVALSRRGFTSAGIRRPPASAPCAARSRLSERTIDVTASYLLVMITALWIIKDRSDQHDRGAHAQEGDDTSEHPDGLCGPPFGFLCISAIKVSSDAE